MGKVLYRFKRIYSPIHSLAYIYEPFNDLMRENINAIHDDETFDVGFGSRSSHCHRALRFLSTDSINYDILMNDFIDLTVHPENMIENLKLIQPRIIWG